MVLKKGGLAFLKELMSEDEVILTPDGSSSSERSGFPIRRSQRSFLLAPCLVGDTDIEAPSGMSRAALS